jgi:hypothetical protein
LFDSGRFHSWKSFKECRCGASARGDFERNTHYVFAAVFGLVKGIFDVVLKIFAMFKVLNRIVYQVVNLKLSHHGRIFLLFFRIYCICIGAC